MGNQLETRVAAATLAVLCFDAGCSEQTARTGEELAVESRSQAIVDVAQTPVERQTIGNCWVYAGTGWIESMHLKATDEVMDLSESYWTYMDWYIALTEQPGRIEASDTEDDEASLPELNTAGNFYALRKIIERYGWMLEEQFIAEDYAGERALSQSQAHDFINLELQEGGRLETAESRKDTELVRSVLDEAWGLSDEVRLQLDGVFGPDMARTFRDTARSADSGIRTARELPVAYTTGVGRQRVQRSLADALREWRTVGFSRWSSRATLRRMQQALHALEPVVVSWFVDFNALEYDSSSSYYGSFNLQTLEDAGEPGDQGGHMTVVEDYQARLRRETQTVLSEEEVELELPRKVFLHFGSQAAPHFRVEANETLAVRMRGTGDADLYVQTGAAPDKQNYSCRPYASGSEESCQVAGPADVYVALHGYSAASVVLSVVKLATSVEEQILAVGEDLDPAVAEDAALLEDALDDSTEIELLRVKNSWGAVRPGLPMPAGAELGYHDLYTDYLLGSVAEKDDCTEGFDAEDCEKGRTPLSYFILPPGY